MIFEAAEDFWLTFQNASFTSETPRKPHTAPPHSFPKGAAFYAAASCLDQCSQLEAPTHRRDYKPRNVKFTIQKALLTDLYCIAKTSAWFKDIYGKETITTDEYRST